MGARTTSLRIVTWNANSIRLRLEALSRIVQLLEPDIVCLQETKVEDNQFPHRDLASLGFAHRAVRGQKSYNGVAILSREPIVEVSHLNFCGKSDCRHIAARIRLEGKKHDGVGDKIISIDNVYVPAGGYVADAGTSEKFRHKLDFVGEMAVKLGNSNLDNSNLDNSNLDNSNLDNSNLYKNNPNESKNNTEREREGSAIASILLGDLNIAPLENDVWAHERMLKERVVSHTEEEIALFEHARARGGWCDVMRVVYPPEQRLYSWWSYRQKQWQEKDYGRRLDHIWANGVIAPHLTSVRVLKEARGWNKPSDHAPVLAEFDTTFC